MKNLVKVKAVLHEDKGVKVDVGVLNVVKENDTAVVLETDDFTTVYKGEVKSEYRDYVNKPKRSTPYSLGSVIAVSGYFTEKEAGINAVKEEVNKYLTEKREYYDQLIITFDNQK